MTTYESKPFVTEAGVATTIQGHEFMDRDHRNTVCVDQFRPWRADDEAKPGDQVITPQGQMEKVYDYTLRRIVEKPKYGLYDGKTLLPILLTVVGVVDFHYRIAVNGNPWGSIAKDLCWVRDEGKRF